MNRTRRLSALLTAAAALTALPAGGALAEHPHHLDLPNGNCVDRGGAGFGTGQDHADATRSTLACTPGPPASSPSASPTTP